MDKSSKNNLTNDIENRLDDFFGQAEENETDPVQNPSLEKLKTVILSMDWEITDACLDDLKAEIESLLPQWQHDRLVHALLRMLKALGRYIRNLKAQAHPDAIKRVLSAFKSLEKLIGEDQISEEQKRKLLAKEIAAFKHLKEQVESGRSNNTPAVQTESDNSAVNFVEHQKFEQAMSDVEKRLNEQVSLLKSQLENVQKEIDALRNG